MLEDNETSRSAVASRREAPPIEAPHPYAAPKSAVRDLQPDLRTFGIRTAWLYAIALVFILAAAAYGAPMWLPILTPQLLGASLGLTILYVVQPVRQVAALRSGRLPWWWDLLFYAVVGIMLIGVFLDEMVMMHVGLFTAIGVTFVVLAAILFVELRHDVRVYSKGRACVFVRGDVALWQPRQPAPRAAAPAARQ